MTKEQLLAIHDDLCSKAKSIMEKKNHDYTEGSDDPFHNFRGSEYLDIKPDLGILLRVQDKMMRIKTFINTGNLQVKDESATDAIIDVINYMVLLKGLAESESHPVNTSVPVDSARKKIETLLHHCMNQLSTPPPPKHPPSST